MYKFIANEYDQYDRKKDNLVLIRAFLSQFDVASRVAILGAVAGFNPLIEIQTNCPDEAEKLWDLKYRGLLQQSLEPIKVLLPFSSEAVQSIALHIFKRRNTTTPNSVYGGLMFKIVKKWGVTDNEIGQDPYNNICMTFMRTLDNIFSRHRSITDLIHYDDFGIHKQVNAEIDNLTDSSNRHIPLEQWRGICIDTIRAVTNVCQFNGRRAPAFRSIDDHCALLQTMLEDVFSYDLFPFKDILDRTCNYSAVVSGLNYLSWVDEDTIPVPSDDTQEAG